MIMAADISNVLRNAPNELLLINLLSDIEHKWYEIGCALKVQQDVLDNLQHSNLLNLSDVIRIWKDTRPSPVTWETVIHAIAGPIVNDNKIADEIHQYHNTGITNVLKKEDPTQSALYRMLFSIDDKWYEFGVTLQVPQNVLDGLKHDNAAKLREIFKIWKDTQPSPITWETVITGIESPLVNKKELADEICRRLKYIEFKRLSSGHIPSLELYESRGNNNSVQSI